MSDIADVIKARMKREEHRFYACDNVSAYIEPEERPLLIDELTKKFEGVLDTLLIDIENDPNSKGTAKRLAKMYVNEIMSGRFDKMPDVTAFPNDDHSAYKGMLVIRAELKSICSHHHQPVNGTAYVAIIPGDKVLGLSKYIRLAQWCARRGTLQEQLCTDIADVIQEATNSHDVAVYVAANHGCCTNRGLNAYSALTQTTVLRGAFNEFDVKAEFYRNIELQEKVANGR